jgi:hypothetical protein
MSSSFGSGVLALFLSSLALVAMVRLNSSSVRGASPAGTAVTLGFAG